MLKQPEPEHEIPHPYGQGLIKITQRTLRVYIDTLCDIYNQHVEPEEPEKPEKEDEEHAEPEEKD